MATSLPRDAFYLDTASGQRFALVTRPAGVSRGSILYLHAFAEEMNKSRRMAALGVRAFAAAGWTVLQIDLAGCGDSAGDFGDACWQSWIDDTNEGWKWLQTQCSGPTVIWGLRVGSLLAADWLAQSDCTPPLLLWQPVSNGKQHLTQFLRLKAASGMQGDSEAKAVMTQLRQNLDAHRSVEVAGYAIHPDLAAGMAASSLRFPPGYPGPVALLEVGAVGRTGPSPALAAVARAGEETGVRVDTFAVLGPAFWQTQEIETCPALIDTSVRALEGLIE